MSKNKLYIKTQTKRDIKIIKETSEQFTMFKVEKFPSYDEILKDYSKEFSNYILPQGDTTFGFWMQTLADLELLDLELQGLVEEYEINPLKRTVKFKGDEELVRMRIAHLEKVENKPTLYAELVDMFGDTNAYGFHNLYPYKGKFYPRVVRTLINAFKLDRNSIILDPFNGSGTTTHEASLMGIKSVGVDITPMGVILAELKNELLFLKEKELNFTIDELEEILKLIEEKKWKHSNSTVYKLMLVIYFDTVDALLRTSKYNRKGKIKLFIEKFNYIVDCHKKIQKVKDKYKLNFEHAKIIQGDALEIKNINEIKEKFDACITSPPYYFSIDYVGKDKIAYDYLGIDIKQIESKYLGMKSEVSYRQNTFDRLPLKVLRYYEDLKEAIKNIYWALKTGANLAIIIGDSTVNGRKIPTTMVTKKFCEEIGFKFEKLIFNPLLGVRNRAIRGESIIICHK
ncbi:MAG: DNA methyltransferase [Endomicrobiia bacterium]